jgi:DNA invertase Pin-like site-specific DNA recombinase
LENAPKLENLTMLIGYARVSTQDQNPELQTDALKAAGCEQLYTDTISGATKQRPQLDELRSYIRKGDTFSCLAARPSGQEPKRFD